MNPPIRRVGGLDGINGIKEIELPERQTGNDLMPTEAS